MLAAAVILHWKEKLGPEQRLDGDGRGSWSPWEGLLSPTTAARQTSHLAFHQDGKWEVVAVAIAVRLVFITVSSLGASVQEVPLNKSGNWIFSSFHQVTWRVTQSGEMTSQLIPDVDWEHLTPAVGAYSSPPPPPHESWPKEYSGGLGPLPSHSGPPSPSTGALLPLIPPTLDTGVSSGPFYLPSSLPYRILALPSALPSLLLVANPSSFRSLPPGSLTQPLPS